MRDTSPQQTRISVRLIPEIASALEAARIKRGAKSTSSMVNEAILFRFRDQFGKRALSAPKVQRILQRFEHERNT